MIRKVLALAALLACSFGLAMGSASAQGYPYGARYANSHDIQGVITDFNHHYNLTVRADGNFYSVALHQGTVINPTGAPLQPGELVNVRGYWASSRFQADFINILR